MEVKIGVLYAPREIVLESEQEAEDIVKAVSAATAKGGAGALLTLVDDKGRRVIVPADKIAYVEIGEPSQRRVGFGAM